MTELRDIRKDIREIEEVASQIKNDPRISDKEKKYLIEELKKVRRTLKIKEQREMAIFTDEVFYGKVPTKLLRDKEIKLQAKGLYSVLHSYANPKELMLNPRTFVSLKTLAKDTGLHKKNVGEWIKALEETGWLTVKHRGRNLSNWYILHSKKKYKKLDSEN